MSMICNLFVTPSETASRLAADPQTIFDVLDVLDGTDADLSLEKSWHALQFLLTGEPWSGDPPLNFLTDGGNSVGDIDIGYGPARIFESSDVTTLNAALEKFSQSDLEARFDPGAMMAADIYPNIWDEPLDGLKREYGGYLQLLKEHVQDAAIANHALLITFR